MGEWDRTFKILIENIWADGLFNIFNTDHPRYTSMPVQYLKL